jgi:hypothetical protein
MILPRSSRDVSVGWRNGMARFILFGAVAVLSTAIATPVFAQAAIGEPGAYAFYHPNASLGIESTPPAAEAMGSIPAHGSPHVGIHR